MTNDSMQRIIQRVLENHILFNGPIIQNDCHIVAGKIAQALREAGQSDRTLINELWEAWPEIRQLVEGWATTTPKEEWSEWDEKVRQLTIQLSFKLEEAHKR